MSVRARTALVTLALGLACAGCGLGAGHTTGGASVTVSTGFGSRTVRVVTRTSAPGSETVMRMLERSFHVSTSYGGGFVDAVDGLRRGGAHSDWFFYVNGVEGAQGAATTAVHQGDHIWWDLHDWTATDSVPAVVGAYPEPFIDGIAGKHYPTTLQCGLDVKAACATLTRALGAAHIPVADQGLGQGSGSDTLGIVVGTWRDVVPQVAAQLLAHGPGASGVYARFADGGHALQLLTPGGAVGRTLGPGAGLVAATADPGQTPTWMILGTDPAGVAAAARAVTPGALHDHFALAVDGGARIPVPLQGPG